MITLVSLLAPALVLALTPVLVNVRPADTDGLPFRSPNGSFGARVEYGAGASDFVPIARFELLDRAGNVVYTKVGGGHTVLDISDHGLVVGADFDGPVSGRAKLHFYDAQGHERGRADIGFWDRHGFCADGSVYCVLDGRQGLRVFTSEGRELYNAGRGHRYAVSPDGRQVALADDREIRLLRDGELVASIPLATPFVRAMAFSPDGERFGYCERRGLCLHRFRDAALAYQYRPTDQRWQFTSLDVGNQLALAGLDLDGGRGTPDRHRRGLVVLLDPSGAPVWQQELRYERWNFATPEARFGPAGSLSVRTADEVRDYRYEEE